jgi:hypothetical protein
MLNYREEHNHRWAHNLAAARNYYAAGELEKFYRGDIPAEFPYPGMKILGAFWTAENMEMEERLKIHLDVLSLKDETEYESLSRNDFRRFLDDVLEMNSRFDLFRKNRLVAFLEKAETEDVIPENWQERIASLQDRTERELAGEPRDTTLLDDWFDYCLRHIVSYARNLIRQGVRTALYVKHNSVAALEKAITPAVEYFSWKINRVFYNEALPQTGFSDLGDIVQLGSYGMLADQDVSPSQSLDHPTHTEKRSFLNTCQLYGFIDSCASFLGMPKGCTSHAYCPFCVGHGRTTMNFVIPPDFSIDYRLEEGLGYGGRRCTFRLEMTPAADDGRCDEAAAKIFGDEELSYQKAE